MLLCQEDPLLTTVLTQALECRPVKGGGFEVRLEHGLFYPEGGGQPCDLGTLDRLSVLAVRKDDEGRVWHRTSSPVEGEVQASVDWSRRFDHMQQHSGQHLLTAVANNRYGLPTVAFHLGTEVSDIELGTDEIPSGILEKLETEVNELIRENRQVRWMEVTSEQYERLPVRSRGLPEGHVGMIRLVEIEGLDLNTCGGTHVSSLGQLQVLKLLHTEKTVRGIRLHYVAGHRAIQRLSILLERERRLTDLLSCGPDAHVASVEKALHDGRMADRDLRRARQALADSVVSGLSSNASLFLWHWDEPDMDLLNKVANALSTKASGALCLVTGGEREGVFLIQGPPDQVALLGPRVAMILDGKGGGRGGRFQGKANRLDRREDAARLLSGGL